MNDYTTNLLLNIFPKEIVYKILTYEPNPVIFHTKLKLEDYIIGQKFAVTKQLKRPINTEYKEPEQIILDYAYNWTNIIKFKKNVQVYQFIMV